ncbi:MAG: hypothetical protein ACI80S_001616 [Pseudohongiellaceae bacterium]|jgi:hypothetical protein
MRAQLHAIVETNVETSVDDKFYVNAEQFINQQTLDSNIYSAELAPIAKVTVWALGESLG